MSSRERPRGRRRLCALALGLALSLPQASVAGTRHYTLKSPDIHISACVGTTLDEIANAFHRRTGRDLTVTDGTRSIPEQARLVALNLREGKNIVALYAAKKLAREITRAYREIPRQDREARGVAVIEATLRAQVQRGEYLSKHMRHGAVDLRIHDLSASERKILAREIRRARVALVDESKSRRPHYHLNFLACLKPTAGKKPSTGPKAP
ncbi:MAG: hypothetical protein B7733_20605 [Myxococcales bacterium FL481]|nr:MAG: hypothetical protein B7733_20605 [Myxococcales bacterium FL481]